MAPVGQMLMQATHLPHCSFSTGTSTGSGRPTSSSPRKKKEPAVSLSSSECLPTQPSPALAANGRSRMGAESTKGRHSPGVACVDGNSVWQRCSMRSPSCLSRLRSTLW
ncbi:hypothetical protein D3C75_1147980 [compost metagenome]